MAEFEELKLTVNLTDNASAGLVALRNQLATVQQSATQSVQPFQTVARQTQSLGTQVRALATELQKLARGVPVLGKQLGGLTPQLETLITKMPMFSRGAILGASAAGALAIGAYRLSNSLGDYARGQIALGALARALGAQAGEIKAISDQMRGIFNEQEGQAQVQRFVEWLQDISQAQSETREKFRQGYGPTGEELMKNAVEIWNKQGIAQALNYFIITTNESSANAVGEVGAQAAGRLTKEMLSKESGGPGLDEAIRDIPFLRPPTAAEIRQADQRLQNALAMQRAWTDLYGAIDKLSAKVAVSLIPYMDWMAEEITKYGPMWADGIGRTIKNTVPEIQQIADIIGKIVSIVKPISAAEAPKVLQEQSPMNALERWIRGRITLERFGGAPAGGAGAGGGGTFLMGGGGTPTLAGGSGADTLGLGRSGGDWYAHMRRSENIEDNRSDQEKQNTEQIRQLNRNFLTLLGEGGGGPGGLGGGLGAGGGGLGRGYPSGAARFKGFGRPSSGTDTGPEGTPFTSPTSLEEAPTEVGKAMLGTGEGGKYTLGDVQAAVSGVQASDTGYTGVGRYDFMGSREAEALGLHVRPGSTQDMVTRKTAVGTITANKYAADDIAGFLNDLKAAGAPLNNFSGVYNPRQKRGGAGWSQHAYGNAVDIETGMGSGPDNSPYLYKWAQAHPQEFAEIQAKHHMRNLYSPGGTHDWGHFEWSPTGKAPPPAPTDAATAERLKRATAGFSPTGPGAVVGKTDASVTGKTGVPDVKANLDGVSGSAYLKGERKWIADELDKNPNLRRYLAGVITHEQEPGYRKMVFEALANRLNFLRSHGEPNLTLADYLSRTGTRQFYGPIRRGEISEAYLRRAVDPFRGPKGIDAEIDEVLAGSNYVKGYTDQGSAGDPNIAKAKVWYNKEGYGDFGNAAKYRIAQQARVAAQAPLQTAQANPPEQAPADTDGDRKVIDKGLGNEASKTDATGTVNVNVAASPVKRKYGGRANLFKPTGLERQAQMVEAAQGPSEATGGL